ncbi:MAG: hypothetical protein U0R17_06960 [Acidimicrobiia bacterium]
MAIFTEQEYADAARISRGLERFHQTIVPYVLSDPYIALKHVILFRDTRYDHTSQVQFSVLDGVDEIKTHPENVPDSIEYFQKLVEGHQEHLSNAKPAELLQRLIDEANKPENNNHACVYILSPDKDLIVGVIDLKDGVLTTSFKPLTMVADNQWKVRSTTELFEEYQGKTRLGTGALFEVNNVLEKTKAVITSPVVPVEGPYSVKYDVPIMIDGNVFRDEVLAQTAEKFKDDISNRPIAQSMCLMATQDWVEPNYTYTNNSPNFSTLSGIVGTDRYVEGNCVEQSIALAINLNGGLGGDKVTPRFRVKPSDKSLRKPVPQFHLDDFDPLSEQTASNRLFGRPPKLIGEGNIEEQNISERGATVRVPGHQFFVVKAQDGFDVYDPALNFYGTSDLYEKYLASRGAPAYIQAVTHFREIDKSRSDFFDKCRAPYRNEDVYKLTKEIFTDLTPSTRSEYLLFSSWNKALSTRSDLIAASFSTSDKPVDFISQSQTSEGAVSASSLGIDEMLLSQEVGFICIERKNPNSKRDSTFITIFKQGDEIFFSAGQDGICLPASSGVILGDQSSIDYKVHAFGGNDIDLMKSLHQNAVRNAPDHGVSSGLIDR